MPTGRRHDEREFALLLAADVGEIGFVARQVVENHRTPLGETSTSTSTGKASIPNSE